MKDVERKRALEMALRQIEKQFGKGSIMKLGEQTHPQVETVSSGALALDIALGVGGFPRGRIIEVFGPESSERRPLRYMRLQRCKKRVDKLLLLMQNMLWIPVYARKLGVNISDLLNFSTGYR